MWGSRPLPKFMLGANAINGRQACVSSRTLQIGAKVGPGTSAEETGWPRSAQFGFGVLLAESTLRVFT